MQVTALEEYAIIAGTSTNLTAPGTPTATARTAGSNETAITGAPGHFRVYVSALNYYGETVVSTGSTDITTGLAGQVVDVTIAPTPGAMYYRIYVSTNASPATGNQWLQADNFGGLKFTLQGTMATSGTNPQAADSGTGGANRIEGLIPTLSGFSATTAGVYPATGSHSTLWQGGYVNQSAGTHLSINTINTALQALWDGTSGGGTGNPGAFRADPAEIIGEGGDIMRLSNDVVQSGAATNYRLFVEQPDVAGVRAGAAVSEFQNPITRSIVKLMVHPWLTQGTALLMSYTVPYAWSQVSNIWEMTMVQDYLSISWPVIDPTFRYSMFAYGALVCNAPFYCGLIQGLQRSDSTPYQ